MILAIGSIVLLTVLTRGAWALHRLWRAIPRSNADFAGLGE